MKNILKIIFFYKNITILLVPVFLSLKLIKDSFIWVIIICIYHSIQNDNLFFFNFINLNIFYFFIISCFVIILLIYTRYFLVEKLLNDTSNKNRRFVLFSIKYLSNILYNLIIFIIILYFSKNLVITMFIFIFIYFTHLIYLYFINKYANFDIVRALQLMPSSKNFIVFFLTLLTILFLDLINLYELSIKNILVIIFIRFLSISIIDFYNYQLGMKNYHFFLKK